MTFSPLSRSGSSIPGWQYIGEQYTVYRFPPKESALVEPQQQRDDLSPTDTAVDRTTTVYEFCELSAPPPQSDCPERKLRTRRVQIAQLYETPQRIRNSLLQGLFCRACGETRTVEWRSGPKGRASLCNACGLRYRKAKLSMDKLNYCGQCGNTKETTWKKSPDGHESLCTTCAQA